MDESQAATRNLRDYLTMYNIFTQKCFNSCVTNLNYRFMTHEENACVQKCAHKLININHRLITVYMEINPLNKYKEQQENAVKEMEAKQIEEAHKQTSLETESSQATDPVPQAADPAPAQATDPALQSNLAKQVGETFEGVQIINTSHSSNVDSEASKTVQSTSEVR